MTSDSMTVFLFFFPFFYLLVINHDEITAVTFSFLPFAFYPLSHALLLAPFDSRILLYGCIVLLLLLKRKKIYQGGGSGMLMNHLNWIGQIFFFFIFFFAFLFFSLSRLG